MPCRWSVRGSEGRGKREEGTMGPHATFNHNYVLRQGGKLKNLLAEGKAVAVRAASPHFDVRVFRLVICQRRGARPAAGPFRVALPY